MPRDRISRHVLERTQRRSLLVTSKRSTAEKKAKSIIIAQPHKIDDSSNYDDLDLPLAPSAKNPYAEVKKIPTKVTRMGMGGPVSLMKTSLDS